MKRTYRVARREAGDLFQFVQRMGEKSDDCHRPAPENRCCQGRAVGWWPGPVAALRSPPAMSEQASGLRPPPARLSPTRGDCAPPASRGGRAVAVEPAGGLKGRAGSAYLYNCARRSAAPRTDDGCSGTGESARAQARGSLLARSRARSFRPAGLELRSEDPPPWRHRQARWLPGRLVRVGSGARRTCRRRKGEFGTCRTAHSPAAPALWRW